jgi:hypothetical protein
MESLRKKQEDRMKSKTNRFFNLFRAIFIFVFIFGMAFPGGSVALAQDVTPPADAPTEVSEPAATQPADAPTSAPEEVTVTEAPVQPTEILPTPTPTAEPTKSAETDAAATQVEATLTAVAEPTAEAAEAAQTDAEKAEKVADAVSALQNTGSVLTDENGNALSLASQQAEDMLTAGDPFFKDASGNWQGYVQTSDSCPSFISLANCHKSGTPFQNAVNDAPNNSTIYVAGSNNDNNPTSYNENITINNNGSKSNNLSFYGVRNYGISYGNLYYSNGYANLNSVTLNTGFNTTTGVTASNVTINSGAQIQDGINLVKEGGTVQVNSGTYNENLTIDKTLTLNGDSGTNAAGAGSNAPVLTGSGTGIKITNNNVTVKGFIIKGYQTGISVNNDQDDTEISNNSFVNNTLYDVYLDGHSGTKITNNAFTDPASTNGRPIGYAIYVSQSTNASNSDHIDATGNFWGGCSIVNGSSYCGPVGYYQDWDWWNGTHVDPKTFYNLINHAWIPAGGNGTTQQGIVFDNWGQETVDWNLTDVERIDLGSPSSTYECASGQYWNGSACVAKLNPTLSVTNPTVTYTGSAQTANVTGSVAGTVSNVKYNGSAAKPTEVGTYAITADFTPDNATTYNSLAGASAGSFVINKAGQTISFTSTAPTGAVIGGTYTPTATATSGLAVVITVDPSSASVCSISSGVVTFNAAGTCRINANQGGNSNYNAAAQVQQSFSVIAKTNPTLSITNPQVTYTGAAQTATVNGSVAGTVSNIKYNGNSAAPINAGSYAVTADFVPTNTALYNRLTGAPAGNFVINKAGQTVSFTSAAPVNARVGDTYSPTATATSGLAVAITVDSSSASVCSISGGVVTFNTAGTCVLDANQTGNGNYNAAAQKQQSVSITKRSPTLSVTNSPVTYNGAAQAANVTGSVAGTVSNVKYGGSATVPTNAGTYTITADFAPQDAVHYSNLTGANAGTFTIGKATPTVSAVGGSFDYDTTAHAGSGSAAGVGGVTLAPVTLSYSGTGSTAYGPTVSAPTNAGTYQVTASFAGNTNYFPASNTADLRIDKAHQIIHFTTAKPVGAVAYGTYSPAATATSGLPVTLSISSDTASVCSMSGGVVTFNTVGTCVVDANQAGNENYAAASPAGQEISVGPATPASITWPTASAITYGQALSASVLSGGSATPTGSFAFTSPATKPDGGTANQSVTFTPADPNYSNVTGSVSVTVNKATPTVSVTGGTFTYDSTAHAGSGSAMGVNEESLSVTLTYSGKGTTTYPESATAPTNAGTYQVTVAFAGNTNYEAASKSADLTINKADPTINWSNPADITYGTALGNTQLNATSTIGGVFTYTPAANTILSVGNLQNLHGVFTPTDTDNYNNASADVKINVLPRAVAVTADAKSKTYGDADPALTYQITSGSLVTGDSFTGTLTRAAGEPVGTYAINQGTLALNSNYTLSFTGANLTITPAPLTITASSENMYVGGQGVTVNPIFAGFKLGDTAASLTTQPVCSATVNKSSAVGNYPSTCAGAASANYSIGYVNGTVRVIAKPAAITGGGGTGVIPVTGGSLTGLSCTSGTTLELDNGNRAIFNNSMCGFSASLTDLKAGELPAKLAAGNTYTSGMTVSLSQDKENKTVELLPSGTTLTISLKLPADVKDKKFAIIYWDPKAKNGAGDWLDLPMNGADKNGRKTIGSVITTADGYLQVSLNFTGSFVLVTQ